MMKEAIILAGGKGTRLQSVVSNLPKPLAPINDTCFLSILLERLSKQGIKHIILSIGYMGEKIMEMYKDNYLGMNISYAFEEEPLGTGGGILFALEKSREKQVLILNGDSYIDFCTEELYSFHNAKDSKLSMVLKPMKDFDRYACVEIDSNSSITGFTEKEFRKEGLINAGVYLLEKEYLQEFKERELKDTTVFSFEKDFLEKETENKNFFGFRADGYFIDIGIPEDYILAQEYFANRR